VRDVKININNFIKNNDLELLEIINLGNYRYHLRVICTCGEEYITPYPKTTNKCKKCHDKYLQSKRSEKTYNDIVKYVKENSSAKLLTLEKDFVNRYTLLSFECECGNVFQTRFNDFKGQNKKTCRPCSNERLSKKLSLGIEGARKWINENTTLTLLSDFYKNNETLLKLKCHCGNEFESSIQLLKMGCNYECPECTKERRVSHHRFDYDYVKKWIEENTSSKLLSTSYKNNSDKLELECECGNLYETSLMHIRDSENHMCRECSYKRIGQLQSLNYEEVKKEIESLTTSKLLSTSYKNYNGKLELECECGQIYYSNFATLRKRQALKCHKCNNTLSKAEEKTDKILKENNINLIRQHIFSDCRYINPLPFDFYLPDINFTIEIDGEHHFYPVNFGQGEEESKEEFKRRVIKDEIRNKYCQDNNIKLLRIPYWDFDKIETILKEHDII